MEHTTQTITIDGKDIVLHEPTAGELRGVMLINLLQMDVEAVARVIPRLCGGALSMEDVMALPVRDFTKLATALVGFFVDTETTAIISPATSAIPLPTSP